MLTNAEERCEQQANVMKWQMSANASFNDKHLKSWQRVVSLVVLEIANYATWLEVPKVQLRRHRESRDIRCPRQTTCSDGICGDNRDTLAATGAFRAVLVHRLVQD